MSLSPRARPRSRLNKAEKKSMDTVELRPLENSEAPADIVQEVVIEETTSLTEWDEDVLRQSAAGMCCSKDYELQQFIHLPDYLKHNPHITHGYRVGLTLRQTTFSLFHWHNETLNVWTHLGGLFLFLVLAITSYTTWLNRAVIGELVTSTVFFLSAMMMLLFSSVFHLYNCCSDRHYDFTAKLDYSGIAVLIAGSYYPLLYYIYYCPNQYLWRYGYGVIITGFGVAALWVIWKGKMHQAGNEALRLFVFLGMGLFGVIPLPQSLFTYGWDIVPTLLRCGLMGFCYVFGSLIYAKKWPESFFPGKFDSLLSSHNIWHCFVLAGAISHYFAVMSAQNFRETIVGTACSA